MSSYNFTYKQKRDFHSNKDRPYHNHHNNPHSHHSYGPKRYNTGSGSGAGGNGSGGGNSNGTGMGMSSTNPNYYSQPYFRQHSVHPHGGSHQEQRSHHHYPHHHHHHSQQPHHHPQHHQNPHHYQHQQRTTSPQQRSQTPNLQHCRQQSPSQSQVNTSVSNDVSVTQKRLWNAVNMEEVASYLEGLYIDAERGDVRVHVNDLAETTAERLPHRRPRPHSLAMESSIPEPAPVVPSVTSPKQNTHHSGFRSDQRSSGGQSSSGSNSYAVSPSLNCGVHPTNGGSLGDYASGSRGGSSSSSHEQGASSSDEQQYATPDPPASPTAPELHGHKPGVQ